MSEGCNITRLYQVSIHDTRASDGAPEYGNASDSRRDPESAPATALTSDDLELLEAAAEHGVL